MMISNYYLDFILNPVLLSFWDLKVIRKHLFLWKAHPHVSKVVFVFVCFVATTAKMNFIYNIQILKDSEGRTTRQILRAYTCPICKAICENSHTINYYPLNQKGPHSLIGVMCNLNLFHTYSSFNPGS